MTTPSGLASYLYNVNNTQSTQLTKSIGLHGQWGLSSAFDILEVFDKQSSNKDGIPSRLNLLFMYPGDIRHIIASISRCRRYFKDRNSPFPEVHFYLLEPNSEILARDLILISIFFHLEMPIRLKSNTFLEVYGNLRVQKRTRQLIAQLAKDLVAIVTQSVSPVSSPSTILLLQQILSLDMFSFRDHDNLHVALQNFFPSFVFKLDELFNTRQRSLYEDRYDNRSALYDWDYHQNYKKTASIIHIKQYKTWRESGIAFEFGDQVYSEANPTFMSYTEGVMKNGSKKGEKQEVLGYWGDLVDSPYIGFGVNSDSNGNAHAEALYEILNRNTGTEQHRHHAVEVALYNLYSYLWELETDQKYQLSKPHDIYSGLGKEYRSSLSTRVEDLLEEIAIDESGDNKEQVENHDKNSGAKKEDDQENDNSPKGTVEEGEKLQEKTSHTARVAADPTQSDVQAIEQSLEILENLQETLRHIHIHPLVASNSELLTKSKFKHLFHGIFVSNRYSAVLKEGEQFQQLFDSSPSAWDPVLAVESLKFLIPVNAEVKSEYHRRIVEYTKAMAFEAFSEPPVSLRRRDEQDKEDDVWFFRRP